MNSASEQVQGPVLEAQDTSQSAVKEQAGTSCVKKYANSPVMRLCKRKRWMYSRLEAKHGGLAWMST